MSRERRVVVLMAFEAATLVVASAIHLFAAGGSSNGFRPNGAGIAEAIIALVLFSGAATLARGRHRGRPVALAAIAFAILGFIVGLTFTVRGGAPADLIYHLTMLPVLLLTLILLVRNAAPPAVQH
jgi:hypothetical protein